MTTEMLPPGMGRCEVTGQVLPEDELVTLNGQRVSAEGKAILLERLKSGEALPGEAERPGVLLRFGCAILDNIILAVPSWIIILGVAFAIGVSAAAGGAGAGSTLENIVTAGATIFTTIIAVAYFTIMHGTSGRSVGKMAGKLKVVRMDGQPMDMTTAFIRAMAYSGLSIIPGVIMIVSPAAAGIVNILVVIYGLANAITALVDSQQQRSIHDRIAGTRVVVTPNRYPESATRFPVV